MYLLFVKLMINIFVSNFITFYTVNAFFKMSYKK